MEILIMICSGIIGCAGIAFFAVNPSLDNLWPLIATIMSVGVIGCQATILTIKNK